MGRVDAAAQGKPGLIRIHAWQEVSGNRLVGIAVWASMEAFLAARDDIFAAVADDPFDVWFASPPDVMILEAE
jgi:hypothetical protein